MSKGLKLGLVLVSVVILCGGTAVTAAPARLATLDAGAAGVEWQPIRAEVGLTLTVSGPEGFYLRREFAPGQSPSFSVFDDAGSLRRDGVYVWELRGVFKLDAATRDELESLRQSGDESALQKSGKLPSGRTYESGSFSIQGGRIVALDLVEPQSPRTGTGLAPKGATLAPRATFTEGVCAGFDCPASPAFGDSTILMMENNTRIKFGDTSVSPFPNNDWEIEANSSVSGALSYLGFNDCGTADNDGGCATDLVFAVEAGARQNSLYVEGDGDVGLGTANPVLDLHIVTGNTPALRLEQDTSSGFTARTWDIAGNETNFFIRDVTGGSTLPLRLLAGADGNSIVVDADGEVGLGTASPQTRLHVETNSLGASARYVNSNGGGFAGTEYFEGATQGLFVGLDNGANTSRINTVNDYALSILTNGSERITFPAAGTDFITSSSGAHLTNTGTWADASSREYKQDIESLAVDRAKAALEALVPVSYRYRANPAEEQVGFIAEEVPELVAMPDRKSLAALEIVAVLTRVVQDQERRIEAMAIENGELRRLVDELLRNASE